MNPNRFLALALFAWLAAAPAGEARAQNQTQDAVYLKNGSIIRGKIIQREPSKTLKIEMSDGSVFVFKADEIDSVHFAVETKEPINESQDHHLYLGARVGADLGSETDGVRSFDPWSATNYGQHKVDPGSSRFMELGFIGGFELDYRLSHFALSGCVLYDQKGVGVNGTYTTEASPTPIAPVTENITLNYFEIPLLVKWNPNASDAGFFIFAGPSFGFLLSGKIQNNLNIKNEAGNSIELSQSDQPSISAIAGLGYSVDLGSGWSLFFDAAYAMGLTNDSFTGTVYSETLYSAASRDIRTAAGILFPID